MTNSWQDIANSTLVVVWGANPSENHPACMAHINRARFPQQFFTGDRANKKPATLVVIDPRKNRTALQADMYVRIRPGTDIAFGNALMAYMIDRMETPNSKYSDGVTPIPQAIKDNFFAYLNQASNGTFFKDGATAASAISGPAASVVDAEGGNSSKYTDARFILNGTDTDYERSYFDTSTNTWVASRSGTGSIVSDFPKKSRDVYTGNTVFKRMKAHLAPYTLETAAEICGCLAEDIVKVGDLFIQNSRHASDAGATQEFVRTYKATETSAARDAQPLWAWGVVPADVVVTLEGSATPLTLGTDYTINPYQTTPAVDYTVALASGRMALQTITPVSGGAIGLNARFVVTYEGYTDQAPQAGYRASTMLYAMGLTQHTCGSQNVKMFANVQTLMGNMGRSGGGINALRGIHNVQGSTDMGVLYHLIPGYSGNPTVQSNMTPAADDTTNAFGKYMDGLWGNTLNSGSADGTTATYDRAYTTTAMGLQQRGFFNMTLKWFGSYSELSAGGAGNRRKIDACYSLWPKTNGDNHIQMFRKMVAGDITAAIAWGQNPAVTEPNQSKVRDGLEALDLLVVADMFETETAACKRNTNGITYLLPAASHVEKAGSSTNSGRTLQWRYEARRPQGNSRDDLELLLRLAKAFDGVGAFSHISALWTAYGINSGFTSVYDTLYKTPYGGFDGTSSNAHATNGYYGTAVSGSVEFAVMRDNVSDAITYTSATKAGSEWVAENIFKEWAGDLGAGGTLWLYTQGYIDQRTTTTGAGGNAPRLTGEYTPWGVINRAKSRDNADPYGNMGFHKWGYSWLVNRRCLYNNTEVAGDQNDFFMGQDSCIRLFAPNPGTLLHAAGNAQVFSNVHNYSRWYRTHLAPTSHALNDKPRLLTGATEADRRPPKHAVYALTGRFPAHTEPCETPSATYASDWGYNSSVSSAVWDFGTGANRSETYPNLVYGGTPVAGWNRAEDKPRSEFPLVMTSIRCVEHFQGGPITRNNWWNVEAEPEPWVEINAADAFYHNADGTLSTNRIVDGDMVNVITARSNSSTDQNGRTTDLNGTSSSSFSKGFRARVGVGSQSNQRTGVGVVAIPWHWGDKGLSAGTRANDLCIDAMDANTTIPEYKACLCRLEKMPTP